MVDIDKAELDKPLVVPDLKINADLADFMPKLIEKIAKYSDDTWLKYCQNLKNKYFEYL